MEKALTVPRGCGSRKAGGIYLECGLSAYGTPIEELLYDPPLAEKDGGDPSWFKPHRSPVLFERDGAWHVVIWVGKEFYENVWDFIEEVRVAGVSRRVPSNFDFSKLTVDSRMFFVHPDAATRVEGHPNVLCFCPTRKHFMFEDEPGCLGGSLYLAKPMVVEEGANGTRRKWRGLPCGHRFEVYGLAEGDSLEGLKSLVADMTTAPGMFLRTAISGIALVRKKDGTFDSKLEERARQAQVDVFQADA